MNSHERSISEQSLSLVLEIKKKFAYVSFNMFPFLFIWVFFRLPRIQHKEQSMLNDRIIKNSNRNYFKSKTSDSWTSSRQDCNLLIAVCQKDPSAQHVKKDRPLVVTECILAAGVCYYMTIFLEILFMSIICKVKLN